MIATSSRRRSRADGTFSSHSLTVKAPSGLADYWLGHSACCIIVPRLSEVRSVLHRVERRSCLVDLYDGWQWRLLGKVARSTARPTFETPIAMELIPTGVGGEGGGGEEDMKPLSIKKVLKSTGDTSVGELGGAKATG